MNQKKRDQLVLVCGIVALFSCFLPLVSTGGVFISIEHMSGITRLLYFVPLLVIGVAIASLYEKVPNAETWYTVLGGIALGLAVLSIFLAFRQIQAFSGMSGFARGGSTGGAAPGVGSFSMIAGYTLTLYVGLRGKFWLVLADAQRS